jgi:hypothetical protein
MTQARRQQVSADVKAFRAFHELGRLLPAKASHRNGYDQRTITVVAVNGRSTAELEAYIAARFGSRRDGERNAAFLSDLLCVLVQLEGPCEGWRRWAELLCTTN